LARCVENTISKKQSARLKFHGRIDSVSQVENLAPIDCPINLWVTEMQEIGFIGAGKMAQALAGGISQANPAIRFVIADPSTDSQAMFLQRVGEARQLGQKSASKSKSEFTEPIVTIVQDSQQVFDACQTIFLAVKPQVVATALSNLHAPNPFSNLVVSVMAGIRIDRIQELTHQQKVIRVMPNTPCLIGLGASAISCTNSVSTGELEGVIQFFESVGIVERVDEALLDSITGLSGSGPAYVFSFIESLIRGGIAVGLDPILSDRFARQTVLGAVTMLNRLNASPEDLRGQVTSPGGTTLAGLERLEELRFDEAVIAAVVGATERSRELGQA
jgi:pyrroline-5-carboxylate reductase